MAAPLDPFAPPSGVAVSPTPTPEEAAVIMAATEALWPRPVLVVDEPEERSTAWRFSGRWWNKPVATRRARP